MQNNIEKLSQIYSVKGEAFEEYKKRALLVLTIGKRPSKNKTLIIVGGQSGAGKSRLVPIANQELQNNAVIVDFDELRSLHPHYEEVNKNYTEIVHRILHADTERVKNEVLQELIAGGYDVIYEGALRNPAGFLEFAEDFKKNGYNIKMYIMSVPKLESYGSTFVRYALALITDKTPRWVEKAAHDSSYEGVKKTVYAFISEGITEDINVFVRGSESPKRIYTPQQQQYEDALTAIEFGRETGRKKAVIDFKTKYDMVKSVLEDKTPELLARLEDWETLYKDEVTYFTELNKGSDYSD